MYLNPGIRNDGIPPSQISPATPTTAATFGTCTTQNAATCVNLPAMGANPKVPDIFMQIDWMQYAAKEIIPVGGNPTVPDHIHNPQLAALNMVGAVFQSHGINIHFDVGKSTTYQGAKAPLSPYIIPAAYSQGGNVVPEASILCLPSTTTCSFPSQSNEYSVLGWKAGFGSIKDGDQTFQALGTSPAAGLPQLFALNRKDTFHYALFAHAIAASTYLSALSNPPAAGSISGVADLPGGDLMVTLGLWRSTNPLYDQVGTTLEQAGTLMHELGHNLDLGHSGWSSTPVCKPNYASVMNYLYQVAGLTDANGNEHLDYSYGLELPLDEDYLSSKTPMGIQLYKVRYFGPFNGSIDTPGQASAVDCNGVPPSALAPAEQNYVLLQGPTVSTPDWSNGLDPLGTIIKSGLDINYDDMVQQVLTDSPDWYSLNLQQVGARAGSNGDSADLGKGDLGKGDLGKGDLGKGDLGKGDLGTAALGQDALGDQDFAAYALSGLGLTPPTGLSVTTTTTPPAPAQYPGASGNVVSWVAPSVVTYYNVYRCNASITPGCTPNVRIATDVLVLNYTDPVSDYMDAPTNLNCNTQTCYNTNYIYDVTAVFVASGLSTESAASNTGTSTVPHQFVTGTIASTSLVYGAESQTSPNAITVNIVGNGTLASVTSPPSSTPTGTQAYCVYTATAGPWSQLAPPTAVIPRNVGTYYIFCTGPATVSTTGVTYNVTNLTYTPPALSSTLTITQAALTITAAPETKTFDGTNTAPVLPLPNPQPVFTGLQYNDTVTGVAEVYTETPPNAGTGLTLSISAYTVNDGNSGGNYNVTTKLSTATGVINKATPTVTATGATCTFNGSPCPAASDSATGVENPVDTLTPVTLSYSGTSNSGAAYGPSATAPTNAGNYTVTASYAGNINYIAGTSMPVAITINKATPTVTATGNTCTFSGLPCAGSGTATGVLTPTDVLIPSVTLSYSGTGVTVYGPNAAAPSGGGSYTVTASFAGNANYLAGTSAPAVITINPATPTVTAAGNTCTFSGSTCPGGGLATGVLSGPDVLTPLGLTYVGAGVTAYGPTAVPPTGGGSYTVTASFGGNANYKAGSCSSGDYHHQPGDANSDGNG